MINLFALTSSEMGLGKLEFIIIGLVILVFPVLFIFASKNLDAKGVFDWMMDKPQDWIGRDKTIKQNSLFKIQFFQFFD